MVSDTGRTYVRVCVRMCIVRAHSTVQNGSSVRSYGIVHTLIKEKGHKLVLIETIE
jgi:hypothetical protein